ncbi:hypothetical protein AVEN_191502-1 [Araneus ventricosus]|uniref:Uncharacterized protein n=1 Tax=Araneus ventricosus TaxID=182803 RepID=A0A4Y1ZNU8_ARAVE|nr:hypothetical protein AVEN_191502-1 [Araneus ventricosus]
MDIWTDTEGRRRAAGSRWRTSPQASAGLQVTRQRGMTIRPAASHVTASASCSSSSSLHLVPRCCSSRSAARWARSNTRLHRGLFYRHFEPIFHTCLRLPGHLRPTGGTEKAFAGSPSLTLLLTSWNKDDPLIVVRQQLHAPSGHQPHPARRRG